MRRIASDLAAESIDRKDGSVRPLRLMPTPLMRYQSQAAGVIDGGVFAYVLATDPELLIVVEALDGPSDGGGSHWRILPARLTGIGLRLSHGEMELWSCDKIDYRSQAGPLPPTDRRQRAAGSEKQRRGGAGTRLNFSGVIRDSWQTAPMLVESHHQRQQVNPLKVRGPLLKRRHP
jgi:hypothetical protein